MIKIIDARPQKGPQERFLRSKAEVLFYGGQAGGGKTWGLLIDPMPHLKNRDFTALTFRRTNVEVTNPGGLWDASKKLYSRLHKSLRPKANNTHLEWRFPSGAKIKFAHLNTDDDRFNYQGSEICYLAFDEITHFSFDQFTYLLSRNRSTCGAITYCRATCNPDKDSWVRKFIDWWIDPITGLAIPARSGVIRYFVISNNEVQWGEQPEDLYKYFTQQELDLGAKPKSFTFIPATIFDNMELLKHNPNYISNLRAQNHVEQARLLGGNWNISYSDFGCVLNRNDFVRYDNHNLNHKGKVIYPRFKKVYMIVDTASTTKSSSNYSVIGVYGQTEDGRYYILDWIREKLLEPDLEQRIVDIYFKYRADFSIQFVGIEETTASAGLLERLHRKGVPTLPLKTKGRDKFLRLSDSLGIIKNRYVYLPLYAPWVELFFTECENFRADMKHVLMDKEIVPLDDQVDNLAYGTSSQIDLITPLAVYKKPPERPRSRPIIFRD